MDGTDTKSNLGANAILGVSMACCRAAAVEKGIPLYAHIGQLANTKTPFVLPTPSLNVLNGGSHAGGHLALQEFMVMPVGAKSFSEAMRMGAEVYQTLKTLTKKKYGTGAANVGDEGGVAPDLKTADEALELITEAIAKSGYTGKVKISMDPASSEFYENGKYNLDFKSNPSNPEEIISGEELADMYLGLFKKYDIISIEDPFAENDWPAWSKFMKRTDLQVVGDDILVTNPKFIKRAIEEKACNSLLLKVNQIGTVTESLQAADMSFGAGWGVMVSHRSGETEDTFIADLAVGINAAQIKVSYIMYIFIYFIYFLFSIFYFFIDQNI